MTESDIETTCIHEVYELLRVLDPRARQRVVDYLMDRLHSEDLEQTSRTTGPHQ